MKIANISDPHLRSTNPCNRIDNFQEAVFRKFEFILNYCDGNGIEILLMSGDLFHTPRTSLGLVKSIVDLLKKYKVKMIGVFGQHDTFFHQPTLENTPMGLLESSGVFTVLNDKPFKMQDIHFYGASWEQEIPEPINPRIINILAIHRMVIKNDKLWHDQKEYVTSGSLLKNNDFDFICSGDNHNKFKDIHKGKKLVNCGSMMRSTVAQKDHEPAIFVFDTDTKKIEEIKIPIEAFEDVALITEHTETKEMNQKLEEYRNALNTDIDSSGLNFENNLIEFMKANKVSPGVQQIIGRSING